VEITCGGNMKKRISVTAFLSMIILGVNCQIVSASWTGPTTIVAGTWVSLLTLF
jgi:hypothetical protein